MLTLCASKKWPVNSIEIEIAFLQGKDLERTVFVRPPKEAQTNKIWKPQKCGKGLADASWYWYLKIWEELCRLGGRPSELDQGIFYFYNRREMIGIVSLFVDALLWAGNSGLAQIIQKLKTVFQVGSKNQKWFTYVGINLKENDDFFIIVDQHACTETIYPVPVTREQISNPHWNATDKERLAIKSAVGQLNWLANINRPEISFQVSNISGRVTKATVQDIREANKIIKFAKSNTSFITFPSLHLSSVKVTMYSDASFNSLCNGASQGGHIVIFTDQFHNSCPVSWKSNKVQRTARST